MIKSFKKFINYVEENYHSSFTEDDIKYQGTIKIIRMWIRYDNVR